jgi:hypothetical protein
MLIYKTGTAHPIRLERALYSTVNDWQEGVPEVGQWCIYQSPSGIRKRMLIKEVVWTAENKQVYLHSLFGSTVAKVGGYL